MKRLFIMCGTAFSGKTTIAKQIVERLQCNYISLDEINEERGLYGGEGIPGAEWERTHSIAQERIAKLMTTEEDIVLDDTACFRWLRDRYREFAGEHGYLAEIVYVQVEADEVRSRVYRNVSSGTRRSLTPAVLADHLRTFQQPQSDESPTILKNETDIALWMSFNESH